MILPIYTYGQSVLRKETEVINQDYPGLKKLINDMFETMYNAEGVGLAAPQIGLSIRLLVIDADSVSQNYPECENFKRVLINPEITEFSREAISLEEGCLSFPGIHEKVSRATKIYVKYKDEDFNQREEEIEGFAARIVQHECEHLEGEVFIDNISPIRRQLNKSKLNNIIKGNVSCSYKIKPVR
ncbi:MAG: peptide deformylase [Tannerella sp.]|jgi:peptide deformylase|nr:peptide deformylase [Tannerella sp.]